MINGKLIAIYLLLVLSPAFLLAQQFGGNPANIKWKQINNATTRIIFPVGMDSQANRINNVNRLLSNNTAYSIGGKQRKWNIILLNENTIPNAYVRMAPIMSELNMAPPQDNFSSGSLRWDDNLIIHENRHMQQLSNFNEGLTKIFSFFLGQEGQLLANGLTIPDYFFEGDAVWQETLVSPQGRGRMPSFYNGMKSLWIGHKKYSWMKLRSGSLKDYTPNYYELGYQLIAYGYEKYGDDFWRKVTGDAVRFKGVFYPFNKSIERHSGKTYPQFRQEAMQYFKERSIDATAKNISSIQYLSGVQKNNVVDYHLPYYVSDDTIVVNKESYKTISAFYLLVKGKEEKIRVKDRVINDYYSYSNGKIVYAAYQSDPRWGNKNYSVIKLLDIHTRQQRQLSFKSKYFSPDINEEGGEVLAVKVNTDGSNFLHRINANTGALIFQVPNPHNYFFTQSKYINSNTAISAVRNPEGKMGLVKVDITSGETITITPFSYNVIGYPFVKSDTVYFTAMNKNSDKIFAVTMKDKKIFQLTNNTNGVYQPAINSKSEMLLTAFTAEGSRLGKLNIAEAKWVEMKKEDFTNTPDLYTPASLNRKGVNLLNKVSDSANTVSAYKKTFQLFNFHSRRPEVNDPEYSYSLYCDNVLSSFSNSLTYTFNRSDNSHTLGFYEAFAGWFPVITLGGEHHFNRKIDTALGKSVQFNSGRRL